MGTTLLAQCECGFAHRVGIGAGFGDDAQEYPALCRHCSAMVSLPDAPLPLRCPRCSGEDVTSYADPALRDPEILPIGEYLQYPTFDAYAAYMAKLMEYTPQSLAEMGIAWEEMLAEWRGKYEAVWRDARQGRYRPLECHRHVCPQCRRMSLEFHWAGSWD